MSALITNKYKSSAVINFIESVNSPNISYYFFTADHLPNSNDVVLVDTKYVSELNTHNLMIQGKQIKTSDVVPIVNKNSYQTGTTYTMYEHDIDLNDKQFFVSVDEGSYIHFYKCLDNNNGIPSTSQPTFSHISGANTQFYRTGDGYLWKYLYTISNAEKLKFGTADYLPVIANSTVTSTAQSKVIDVIKVDGQGRKYDNFLSSSFGAGDITISGNSTLYKITDEAKNSNSFYSGCLIYLSSGTGAGQHKTIIDYFSNNTGKFIVLNSAFATRPTNGTGYQINPQVLVKGTGGETAPVVARALVNALSTNSVYRVEIIEKGMNFSHSATATVVANSVVGVQSNAKLKVILPPTGGHGFDILDELNVNKYQISVKLANTENSTVLSTNGFKQIGLIKNPLFSNVVVNIQNNSGIFLSGETIYKISPQKILSNLTTNSESNVISVALDSYNNNLKSGHKVLISNGSTNQLSNVVSVNSSILQISTNAFFDSSNVTLYFANETSKAKCLFVNNIAVRLSNCEPFFSTNDTIIGENSGAFAKISSINRSGVSKNFDTFINLSKFEGTLTSGTFEENEKVFFSQLDYANGYLHSSKSSNVFTYYVSSIEGDINNSNTIGGVTTFATATIENRYSPEIEFNSGEVLYLENINRITRSANTSETFQLIFEF